MSKIVATDSIPQRHPPGPGVATAAGIASSGGVPGLAAAAGRILLLRGRWKEVISNVLRSSAPTVAGPLWVDLQPYLYPLAALPQRGEGSSGSSYHWLLEEPVAHQWSSNKMLHVAFLDHLAYF